jgi:hypothetical protein
MTTLHEDLYAFLLVKWLNMYWSKEYLRQKIKHSFYPQYTFSTTLKVFRKIAEVVYYAYISELICSGITMVSGDTRNLNYPCISIIHMV